MRLSAVVPVTLQFVLGLRLLCTIPQACAQQSNDPAMKAASPEYALGLTVDQAYGQNLRYDYGPLPNGTQFELNVTFRPGEVYWEQLWDGKTETDPTKVVRLDDHRILASWPEESGWFIALYADFLLGETSFCSTNNPGDAASSSCRTGTITTIPDK